jgi:hypothetical protein
LAALVGLVLSLFAGLVVTATSANAHHAELTATASCSNDGHYVINYTARSWKQYKPQQDSESWRALNSSIEILWRFPGESKTVGATGAFTAETLDGSKVPVFSGQIVLPLTDVTSVQLQTHAANGWGPNPADGQTAAGNEWWPAKDDFISVNLPSDCQRTKPGFTINECAEGGIAVTLTNEGGGKPAKYQVNGKQVTVPRDHTKVETIPANENQSVRITITLDGKTLFDENVLRDCLHPQPKVGTANTCAANGIAIPLINSGTEAAVFTVNGTNVTVAVGQTTTFTVPAVENQTVHVTITSGGATLLDQDFTRDCLHPKPSVEVGDVCAAAGVPIKLINSGDDIAVFTVNGANTPVAAHQSATITIPLAENETKHVTITSGGVTLLDQDLTKDCLHPKPSVEVGNVCAAGGIPVKLINSGDDTAVFTVNGTDTSVAAHHSTTVTIPADENETVHVTITSGGQTLLDRDYTRDCRHPKPTVEVDDECAEGGVAVELGNRDGEDVAVFTIAYGDFSTTVTVPAGATRFYVVPVPEDGSLGVTITAPGMEKFSKTLTRDCQEPTVDVVDECAEDGVAVELGNEDGVEPTTFTVDYGETTETVTVPAGRTEIYTVPVDENHSVDVTITAPGLRFTETLTRDCLHPEPTVSAGEECADDGVEVVLGNEDGNDDAIFTITYDEVTETVTVPAGETETYVVPVPEDESVDVTFSAPGMVTLTKPLARDCLHPQPTVAYECAEGGIKLLLANEDGEDEAFFTITYGGDVATTDTIEVAEGGTEPFMVPVAEGESVDVTVTAPGMEDFTETLTRDCQKPVVTVAEPCVDGQVAIVLSNEGGTEAATFTVTYGNVNATVTVEPGQTVTHPLQIAEDATQRVVVTSGGVVVFDEVVTADCQDPPTTTTTPTPTTTPGSPQQVTQRPTSTSSTSTLASTGASTITLVAVAAGLLIAGGLLYGGARHRRQD